MGEIKIIGIDPAPGKKSCVCDPHGVVNNLNSVFQMHDQESLYGKLKSLKNDSPEVPVLICWDAPLTAKRNLESEDVQKGDFTMRDIEKKYRAQKLPKGISVLPYCSAPHWTFSQFCLGLPQVGGAMKGVEPLFPLITSDQERENIKLTSVVEVHPAVALHVWLAGTAYGQGLERDWKYKRNDPRSTAHANALREELALRDTDGISLSFLNEVNNDDELDAAIAYLLGSLWLKKSHVKIDGSRAEGAWLMPENPEI